MEALLLEERLTLWLKLFTKPFVNLLQMQMRNFTSLTLLIPEKALSNDFRGQKNLFIYHYCHGLSQMITICLHPIFRQWATIESRKAILPDGRRCFHCKMLSFLCLPHKIGLSENRGCVLMSGFPVDIMTYNTSTQSWAKTFVHIHYIKHTHTYTHTGALLFRQTCNCGCNCRGLSRLHLVLLSFFPQNKLIVSPFGQRNIYLFDSPSSHRFAKCFL